MKKLLFIAALISFSVLTGCKKDRQKAEYTFNFNLVNNGTDYNLNETYKTSNDVVVKLEALRFYISNIIFINDKNEEVLAKDIDLVTFDLSGTAVNTFSISKGNYQKIKFSIGVPKNMNEADPTEFNTESGHPLNGTNNTYWGWTAMYRFLMIEGRFDADGNGENEGLISLHTGYESAFRTNEFIVDLDIKKKGEYASFFDIDVYDFFDANTADNIDISVENQYHGSQEVPSLNMANRLSNNFSAAISHRQ